MRIPRRATLYAALALCAPLPALASAGGGGDSGLGVRATLGECSGDAAAGQCAVAVSFDRVPDADYYSASVVAPDGGTRDYGTVAGAGAGRASTSLDVPYSGAGTYTVVISAWARGVAEDELVENEDGAAEDDPRDGAAEEDPQDDPAEPEDPEAIEGEDEP